MKRLTLLLAFLVCVAMPARAQFHLGAHGGYDLEAESPLIGVTTHFALPNTSIVLAPSLDYFLSADHSANIDQTLLAFHVEGLYLFGIDNQVFTPYAGVGASILYSDPDSEALDSSTDFGVNLTGGAIFGGGNLRPFAAARVRLTGESLTSLLGGVMFRF